MIWYDGKIIYLPKEYFELKNLDNVDLQKRQKCVLIAIEIKLIRELKSKGVSFLLESNLEIRIKQIELAAIPLPLNLGLGR